MIYLLFALAVILFVVGVIYLYRGYQTTLEEKNAVPLQELQEIKEWKKASDVSQGEETAPLTKHLVQESLKSDSTVSSSQEAKRESSRLEELLAENQRLQKALHQELSSKDTSTLSVVEREKLKEKESQLKQAKETIAQLTEESLKWRKQLGEKNEVSKQLESQWDQQKKQDEQVQTELRSKIKSLEETLDQLRKQSEAIKQGDESVRNLEAESESLRRTMEEQAKRMAMLEEALASSHQEGEQLKLQAHNAIERFKNDNRLLNEQWQRSEGELQRLNSEVTSMQQETESKIKQALSDFQQQFQSSSTEIEGLKKQNEELLQAKADWDLSLAKIKEFNAHLLEKEKILRYELTKSRAQALGFEKLCEDFKIRIENQVRELDHIRR